MAQVHVDILEQAKKLLIDEKQSFICVAVEQVSNGSCDGYTIVCKIQEILLPYETLGQWIRVHRPELFFDYSSEKNRKFNTAFAGLIG